MNRSVALYAEAHVRHGLVSACVLALLLTAAALTQPAAVWAQDSTAEPAPQAAGQPGDQDGAPGDAKPTRRSVGSPMEVYAHTFRYRDASDAVGMVRHRLSPRGTVEVQPSANTLVVRDAGPILEWIKSKLVDFDQPPSTVRLELHVVKAGPKSVVSPQVSHVSTLPPSILQKLQSLLRYDTYEVLAEAAVSSLEGETVDYSLGPDYSVSFKVGSLMAQRRLHMEDFRIVERPSSDKGRGLDPKQLFHADLNLWMDRPFTLVLTRDDTRQEALLVAITGRVEESSSGADSD